MDTTWGRYLYLCTYRILKRNISSIFAIIVGINFYGCRVARGLNERKWIELLIWLIAAMAQNFSLHCYIHKQLSDNHERVVYPNYLSHYLQLGTNINKLIYIFCRSIRWWLQIHFVLYKTDLIIKGT